MYKKIPLFVHAYAVYKKGGFEIADPFMSATLTHVAKVHNWYEQIIHLGGWHSKELAADRLLCDIAKEQLIFLGVPKKKIKTMRDFDFSRFIPSGQKYRPSRTTEEEIDMAKLILEIMDIPKEIHVALIDMFATKALWYYEYVGIEVTGLQLAKPELSPEKRLKCTQDLLEGLEDLKRDPRFEKESSKEHLKKRTLSLGYTRPF